MLSATLGLIGAIVYGGADFLGGLASRRLGAVRVTALSAVSGLALIAVALPLIGGTFSAEAVRLGILSGVTGAIALSLLYGCLAIGPMSILSPLTAVVSALVPLTVGLAGGERLSLVGWIAIGIALVAVVLVGFVPEKGAARPRLLGLAMAVGAGAMIGLFLVIIDRTPDDSGLVPLLLNRATSAAIMVTAAAVLVVVTQLRGPRSPDAAAADGHGPAVLPAWAERAVLLAIACGAVDAVANVLLLLALRAGELTVVSVLTALYPAGTVILAAVLLRERVAPVQVVGLVLAFVAAGMLALA
ncbi:EamA family transporter [Herbiconiux flava]|uniref:Drug/metabolite transporter (DMT)-like permease n=1 Tax=Herbiconiux flava TaxID=881268 RepID=A0A852SLM1_9MICO|nr:EamA family transporter [Herbiconiux flava]NYD69099.1 drug/metabolite transporter (DMT)-like permease [Herbiconiux flava]GLK15847.1 membrane protein [Herbiconiux flava]